MHTYYMITHNLGVMTTIYDEHITYTTINAYCQTLCLLTNRGTVNSDHGTVQSTDFLHYFN